MVNSLLQLHLKGTLYFIFWKCSFQQHNSRILYKNRYYIWIPFKQLLFLNILFIFQKANAFKHFSVNITENSYLVLESIAILRCVWNNLHSLFFCIVNLMAFIVKRTDNIRQYIMGFQKILKNIYLLIKIECFEIESYCNIVS